MKSEDVTELALVAPSQLPVVCGTPTIWQWSIVLRISECIDRFEDCCHDMSNYTRLELNHETDDLQDTYEVLLSKVSSLCFSTRHLDWPRNGE